MSYIKKRHLSTTQIILLSFFIVILVGGFLLSLPLSSANGRPVPYVDAFFTATTAACVTGLVTVNTAATWSVFGQIVILILIQAGGLGIITIMTGIMLLFNKRIGIGDRMLIQDSFNLNTMSGLVRFVKKVISGTFAVELVGALFYMLVFVPEFGARGIWISVFNSVSAFCNAGIDIIGDNSLCNYAANPIINATTCALIIFGGIGYIVWWDIIRVFKTRTKTNRKIFRFLTLHSKIAILSTLILLAVGAVMFFIFEYNNPLTIKNMSVLDKIQISVFQSVTTRTAGFASVPQESLSNASSFVSLLLMFIGGSPVGTAGGVKTVTIAVLIFTALSMIKDKNNTAILGRSVSRRAISKAVAVVVTSFTIIFVSAVLTAVVTNAGALDILFETVSAAATVGLSRNLTSTLNLAGKLIIIFTMYFGRVGPISLAIMLGKKKSSQNIVKEPTEEIIIG